MIIDFHVHTFPEKISSKVIDRLSDKACIRAYTDGTPGGLIASMEEACIDYSVNLPVMTDPSQVEKLNTSFIKENANLREKGIVAFGGLHPDCDPVKAQKELIRLKDAGIPGIKLHPAYQGVDLTDIRTLRLIDAACQQGMIVLIHAGIDIGIYDHNYSPVDQILQVLNDLAPDRLVLAHFGNWGCWDQVESDLAGAPVWFDTAFSIGPVEEKPGTSLAPEWHYNLHDEDFIRIARKHGVNRILFATDSPWSDQKDYARRIRAMDLDDTEKAAILGGNARKLLGL